jgi:hypothetical protein
VNEDERDERRQRAEALGRAAERFGRRVARDARRFAEQVGRHAEKFAHDLGRPGSTEGEGGGLGRLFGEAIQNVDDMIVRLWQSPPAEPSTTWRRVTAERDVTCVGCRKRVRKGSECWRSPGSGTRTRCVTCGVPESTRSA